MYRIRSISNLLAMLIVLTIVVGIAVAVALVTSTYAQRLKPKGSALSILSVKAYPVTQNRKYILVDMVASVTGAENVRIQSIGIYWEYGGTGYWKYVPPKKPDTNMWFPPGSMISILAYFQNLDNPPGEKAPIRVVVEYCTQSGCHRVTATTILEPYE